MTDTTQAPARGRVRVEQGAKRVRALLGGQTVVDTLHPSLVWEIPYYPAYYLPRADVRAGLEPTGAIEPARPCPLAPVTCRDARACRSPGSSGEDAGQGPGTPADMVFLDLEDAVAPLEKEEARGKVVDAIRTLDWGEKVLCVRVNAWSTEWTVYDMLEVVGEAGERLDEIMLPKVRVGRRGRGHRPAAHPGREDHRPAGRPHRDRGADRDRARAHQRRGDLRRVVPARDHHLRAGRLAASMEMPVLTGGVQIPNYPGDHFHYVFSKILMAGRANGLQVIDGPYLDIRDRDGFREYCHRAHTLGYDGKWALHPGPGGDPQRGLLAHPGAVRPGLGHPRRVPAATEDERKGAVMFGDEMIDEASREDGVKFVVAGRAGRAEAVAVGRGTSAAVS